MIKVLLLIIFWISSLFLFAQEERKPKYDVFSFEKEVILQGTPEQIYDAATGDISGWWDHSFSDNPKKFYIEPKPGGGFWEIFDDEGNGILHAKVIAADRGKLLRFDGPLGLAGIAIQIVTTYSFEPAGSDSALFIVSVHASGEVGDGIPAIVESVWDHFIFEQFQPYIQEGKHLEN
ncbi:MAG: SRPBCC domain-containing protein [Ignavibacteria bacterium]|nr:SRPBCC domain-containing protein [Ignavibacteria bacterium]MBT8382163.1 SRPBCC domain-containing protein [Ignavibacteria bacterium]MBT8392273.1 SRPBCC domain-containing protein [Ignavibacteria bacterium]NNJ53619.1 SRPBCC domain-containing protein [Ignavibacteriaceae bacterium]NNL20392.1 SRPBCC domain-containing protein [Ignavibacteriaceae bacterium]